MNYISVSFTHKNTDIIIREKLSFSNETRKKEILRLLKSNKHIKEAMVLSTCNRVEVLAFVSDFSVASRFILLAMSKLSGVEFSELEERADIYEDEGAIHHLFSVAASLDSLVVGETQIVGQLRDAYNFAKDNSCSNEALNNAIEYAFKCAANVRNKTNISKNPISVSSVAVNMAKQKFGSLEDKKALVIGAGEMSELACKHLINAGAKITLINRSKDHAVELANSLSCSSKIEVKEYANLADLIGEFELIFSATSSPKPIITDAIIKETPFKRYFFDIAVPRDITLSDSEDYEVFAVDDLEDIVRQNLILREEQAQIAYSIVSKSVGEFFAYIKSLASTPIIKALHKRAKNVAEIELEKAIKRGYLKHSNLEESRKLIHQVFKAFLHTPTVNLKHIGDDFEISSRAFVEIFGIDEDFQKFCNEESLKIMEKQDEI